MHRGTAWLWVHENAPGNGHDKGGHCHLLVHVPADLVSELTGLQKRWLRRITGRPYRRNVIHSVPIGGLLGLETGNPELHAANLAVALGYVMKGAGPEAASQFALERLQAGRARHRQALQHFPEYRRDGAQGKGLTMAKRTKATTGKAAPQSGNYQLNIIEGSTLEEAEKSLSENMPGWDKLTKLEQAEAAKLAVRLSKTQPPVKTTITPKPEGGKSIDIAGDCEALGLLKLYKLFAASSMEPINARASELLNYLGSVGADNSSRYNAALSFIDSMDPQDQMEALLLVQMYVTHDAAIRALSQLGKAEWVDNSRMFGNLATKLLRTSQGQMETLSKLRRGGEQVVRHVHVDNRGGQAVIAENVHQGGQQNAKTDEQSHAAGAAGPSAALPSPDPLRDGVPIPSRERAEAVPYARGNESGRS